MVAVPRTRCTVDALRRAVAAEHEQCRPEFGKVTVRNLYGLRTHEAMGASQWVAVTDVALRHRADQMSWLMAELETSKRVAGVETMDFASPGMSLTNRSTWEAVMGPGRAGILPSPLAGTPNGGYGYGGNMMPTPVAFGAPGGGTPMTGPGAELRPLALANSLSVLGKRPSADANGATDAGAMPPPPSRAKVDDAADKKARQERAEAAAEAHLSGGVKELFKHGGEDTGSVPLRNVVFAKSLLANAKFVTAVEKFDTSSLDALLRTVEPAVHAIVQTQKDSTFDMFDDLLSRLNALNAGALAPRTTPPASPRPPTSSTSSRWACCARASRRTGTRRSRRCPRA